MFLVPNALIAVFELLKMGFCKSVGAKGLNMFVFDFVYLTPIFSRILFKKVVDLLRVPVPNKLLAIEWWPRAYHGITSICYALTTNPKIKSFRV